MSLTSRTSEVEELRQIRELCIKALMRATGYSREAIEDAPLTCAVRHAEEVAKLRIAQSESEAWLPLVSAPLDGTEIELLVRHHDYWTAFKLNGPENAAKIWQGPVRAKWIDHNGGGWTWHGHSGVPVGWKPLRAER